MMSFIRKISASYYLFYISIICILIMLLPEGYRANLYLDLDQAADGQYWRYVSGHFTHYSWLHCMSNLLGMFLLYALFHQSNDPIRWLQPTLFTLCVISIGLSFSSVTLTWYIGYSGILTGLLSYTCIRTFTNNAILSFTFLLLITTYVAAQTILGGELARSEIHIGIHTSSYAHLFGLFAGCVYGLSEQLKSYLTHYQDKHW